MKNSRDDGSVGEEDKSSGNNNEEFYGCSPMSPQVEITEDTPNIFTLNRFSLKGLETDVIDLTEESNDYIVVGMALNNEGLGYTKLVYPT
jgi:hypothetical protein